MFITACLRVGPCICQCMALLLAHIITGLAKTPGIAPEFAAASPKPSKVFGQQHAAPQSQEQATQAGL